MISFEEARAIVLAHRSTSFPKEAQYRVADWGLENDTHYELFDVYDMSSPGATAWIQPNDEYHLIVNKETGEYLDVEEEIPNATPVGRPITVAPEEE